MATLKIDLGLKSFEVCDTDGNTLGTIRFNPSDPGLLPRWKDAEKRVRELASTPEGEYDTADGLAILNGLIDSINWVIEKVNGISFTNPFTGNTVGFNFPSIGKIPYLAQGAVIPPNREFMAVLGDQSSGTNIEAPLETIKQALSEVMTQQGGGDINIKFTGDLAQLARVLQPVIEREQHRRGTRLVKGVV